MHKYLLAVSSIFLSWNVIAQGIQFSEAENWDAVVVEAKQKKQYIFVDCYATWCGPCKYMDQNIFPVEDVGTFTNEKFVSVKIQMDVTKQDAPFVQNWRKDAKMFADSFNVKAYPTYLVFDPNGKIVHRFVGSSNTPEDFLEHLSNSLNPAAQYYTNLAKYKAPSKDLKFLLHLFELATKAYDQPELKIISNNIVDLVPEKDLLQKKYVTVLRHGISEKDSKAFKIVLNNKDAFAKIDTGINVNRLLAFTVINDALMIAYKDNKEFKITESWIDSLFVGNYKKIEHTERKLEVMIREANRNDDYNSVVKYNEEIFVYKKSNLEGYLNDQACAFFENVNEKDLLEVALRWSRQSVDLSPENPMYLDTYANILYKLGNKEEAITIMEKAISLFPAGGEQEPYVKTLETMKKGDPTWEE